MALYSELSQDIGSHEPTLRATDAHTVPFVVEAEK